MDLKTSKKIMVAAVEALRQVFGIHFEDREAVHFLERRVVNREGEPFLFRACGARDFEFDLVSRPSGLLFRVAIPAGSPAECEGLAKQWVDEAWQLLHGAFREKASFYAVEKRGATALRLIYKMPRDGAL